MRRLRKGSNMLVLVGLAMLAASVVQRIRQQQPTLIATQHHHPNYSKHYYSLAAAELPGYTGWARPSVTLAGSFSVVQEEWRADRHEYQVMLQCDSSSDASNVHISCDNSRSWFYVRAYGPAVVTGTVTRSNNNHYVISIPMYDPGTYTVEVVLTFSHVPEWQSFPMSRGENNYSYEGYVLPDFPRQVVVLPDPDNEDVQSRDCTMADLQVRQSQDALVHGRWRVVHSNRYDATSSNHLAMNKLTSYQHSYTGIGIRMQYQRLSCQLLAPRQLVDKTNKRSAKMHLILIGDSTMRLQKKMLEQWFGRSAVRITFVELYGGVLRCHRLSGPKIDVPSSDKEEQRIVVFNTGLHDIHRLCGTEWHDDRQQYLTPSEQHESCVTLYATALQTLGDQIAALGADLTLFQTTTAAWPKYGNFGVAWNPTVGQDLPLDAGFIDKFNEIAIDFWGAKGVPVVDAYWMSFSRPDHREIDRDSQLSKKLSHPGVEVVEEMVRTWLHFVLMRMGTPSPLQK